MYIAHIHNNIILCICYIMQSVIAKGLLNSLQEQSNVVPVIINFSAQTSSGRTQEIIESKLDKKRKTILGKEGGRSLSGVANVYEGGKEEKRYIHE